MTETGSPLKQYKSAIDRGELSRNYAQAQVASQLQVHYEALERQHKDRQHWRRQYKSTTRRAEKGVYIWGPVGIGKTTLIEMLYRSISGGKMRTHFHAFMNDIHQKLHANSGTKNPLAAITKQLGQQIQLLFLDEFIVNDIADAMVLAGLLNGLNKAGICLLTTSNIAPKNLYEHGFQREKFMPTIHLIEQQCQVISLTNNEDYRRLHGNKQSKCITPLSSQSDNWLEGEYRNLSHGDDYGAALVLFGRTLKPRKYNQQACWFDFNDLCQPPRSARDYLALAKQFNNMVISNIPTLEHNDQASIALFILLIDILYDAKTTLIISTACPIDDLKATGKCSPKFERARSRLLEMTA